MSSAPEARDRLHADRAAVQRRAAGHPRRTGSPSKRPQPVLKRQRTPRRGEPAGRRAGRGEGRIRVHPLEERAGRTSGAVDPTRRGVRRRRGPSTRAWSASRSAPQLRPERVAMRVVFPQPSRLRALEVLGSSRADARRPASRGGASQRDDRRPGALGGRGQPPRAQAAPSGSGSPAKSWVSTLRAAVPRGGRGGRPRAGRSSGRPAGAASAQATSSTPAAKRPGVSERS